ncbi:MAG: hypothetical protein E7Z88_03995 [Cyanobacteria bacterium SIG27]|nr:hypothetical protein [Cyanobacteria bacterium SIG27]
MQVANTLNNSIRILFNPRIEPFRLFDFLVVKSDDSRYIAQIIEIYDDKFDASQNVAKIKLFYRITQNNEVMPYDNFTPNKECEIVKINQDEIEDFINQDKDTFILGTNTKNSSSFNIQYDFFNNNAIILADKIENANCISFNLAKKLSNKRNVVILDSTGILELEGVKKIKAAKNFKLPLNYTTIDWAFNRCLKDASLEFQAIGVEIINEIKKFARKQEGEFIPFNLLTRVLIQQHKATPYPELKLLLSRLKKYQMDEIFAKTKNEKENLFKAIEKNPITIIDLSEIDTYWQRAYINYIITSLEQEIYLITRVNDEHFGTELINKIYNNKKNIKFIPNVSYNYKKLPTLMQHCKNYVLMPSLYQRQDFLDANFALSNLISDGCVVFGENTDNFLYIIKDYELEVQEKRKNYRKIALTLASQEEIAQENLGQKGDYFENKAQQEQKAQEKLSDSQILIKELSAFEASQQEVLKAQEKQEEQETFEQIEEPQIQKEVELKEEDLIVEENNVTHAEIKTESEDEFQDLGLEEVIKQPQQENEISLETSDEEQETELIVEEIQEETVDEIEEEIIQEQPTQKINPNEVELEELGDNEELPTKEISAQEIVSNKEEQDDILVDDEDLILSDDSETTIDIQDDIQEKQEEQEKISVLDADLIDPSEDVVVDNSSNEEIDSEDDELTDDELDFFQMAQDSDDEDEEDNDDEEDNKNNSQEDDIDLNEIADNSIDNNFEEIINTKNQQNAEMIEVDEKTKLSADILETKSQKENLPIFKDEEKEKQEAPMFKADDIVVHKTFGRGTITKVTLYEGRQLVNVVFDDNTRKLLDPVIAGLTLEQ